MIKYLLITFLLGLYPLGIASTDKAEGCDNLKLSVRINSENGLSSSIIDVTGGVAPIYYLFFYPDGKLVERNRDVTSNKIEKLKKGKYICAVTDEAGCAKKIEFEIE